MLKDKNIIDLIHRAYRLKVSETLNVIFATSRHTSL